MDFPPWAFSVLANVIIGGMLLTIAALVRAASPDRAARGPLALYLALVASNYVLDAGGKIASGVTGQDTSWLHSASLLPVFLDPAVFLVFALAATDRRPSPGLAALLVSPGVALLVVFLADPARYMINWPYRAWYLAMLGAYYAIGYGLLLSRYLGETRPIFRDRLGVLAIAFGVVVVPRIPLLLSDYGYANPGSFAREPWRLSLLLGALAALTVALYLVAAPRVHPANRSHARRTANALLALLAAVAATWALIAIPLIGGQASSLLYSVRWILFAAVLSVAVRRYDLLGLSPPAQLRVRRAFTGTLVLLALAEIAAVLAPLPGATVQLTALASAAVVGLCAIAYSALRRAIPDATPEAALRRIDVYRAHVDLGTPAAELADVRARLALSEAEVRTARAGAAILASPIPAPSLVEGTVLSGRWEVRSFLGAGSFGRVFLGYDRVTAERVVLKELLPSWRGDEEAVARFRAEASIALRIHHPNLVQFRALERVPGGHILVLSHVEGETLRKRLESGPLKRDEAPRIARDLADALAALHAAGIVHRDVKPDNVIVQPDGRAVLLDFGSASMGAGTRLARGPNPGTPAYMSPEQAQGAAVGPEADLYSLGVLLWESVTAAPPPLRSPPPGWEVVLARALEPDPAARWRSARELRDALPT